MQFCQEDIDFLEKINKEYLRLCNLLEYEEVVLDKKLCIKLEKDKKVIEPIAIKYQKFNDICTDICELEKLIPNIDASESKMYKEELMSLNEERNFLLVELERDLKLYGTTFQNIIIEIVPNKSELSLVLVDDILKGYSKFCDKNNLTFQVIKNKSIQMHVMGFGAKELFEHEVGCHNAVKDRAEDSCQVFVFESFDEEIPTFTDKDIMVVTCRSSGAGGQHINTTDSAIKVTHLKTGISVTCQDERSQFQNKQIALENLKTKVNEYYLSQKSNYYLTQKKQQLHQMKNVVKTYDYNKNQIQLNNNRIIRLDDFLCGEI